MRIEKSSRTVFTPLDNGSGVLLNLDTLLYYNLNRTAAALWQEIEAGSGSTLEDLVGRTCERFEIDPDSARFHVGAFVERLKQFKMIQ